jgi:hypothetical protein
MRICSCLIVAKKEAARGFEPSAISTKSSISEAADSPDSSPTLPLDGLSSGLPIADPDDSCSDDMSTNVSIACVCISSCTGVGCTNLRNISKVIHAHISIGHPPYQNDLPGLISTLLYASI